MKRTSLIIFAREPVLGKVKTRLAHDLPQAVVLNLYKAFVKDVLKVASESKVDGRFLYYAGRLGRQSFLSQFGDSVIIKQQRGEDLGSRMHHAFTASSRSGFSKTVIIGTDCLTLRSRDIERAYRLLDRHDAVLGPAKDGGYYLIGLTQPDIRIFNGMVWSKNDVLERTIERIKKLRKKIALLREQDDIDTIVSLKRLAKSKADAKIAVNTFKRLESVTI